MKYDCGDGACKYAPKKMGMRTNGGCVCDECPTCGVHFTEARKAHTFHRVWCGDEEWKPPWQRGVPYCGKK